MIELPEIPGRIAALPRDERGYPVPWFVAWVEGKPIFQMADARKLGIAIREQRCWICGELMTGIRCFVIGPMCSINRVSAEPPMHRDCAVFSVKACPFLSKPKMGRNMAIREEHSSEKPPGHMIERNPGVSLIWHTRRGGYTIEQHDNGVLFSLWDAPAEWSWWAEGRTATRDEVVASIQSGYPALADMAKAEGVEAEMALSAARRESEMFLPA